MRPADERPAAAREEHPQVGVDLGNRADGTAAACAEALLVDHDAGGDVPDGMDRRPGELGQPAAGVRAERLDELALRLGADGVEDERRLAAAAHPRERDEPVLRHVDVDPLEVVRAGASDLDEGHLQLPVAVRQGSSRGQVRIGPHPSTWSDPRSRAETMANGPLRASKSTWDPLDEGHDVLEPAGRGGGSQRNRALSGARPVVPAQVTWPTRPRGPASAPRRPRTTAEPRSHLRPSRSRRCSPARSPGCSRSPCRERRPSSLTTPP